jgi:hypothetical protein
MDRKDNGSLLLIEFVLRASARGLPQRQIRQKVSLSIIRDIALFFLFNKADKKSDGDNLISNFLRDEQFSAIHKF